MNADKLLAEALLDDRVASRRGVEALLAFWRHYRHRIPAEARIDKHSLTYLRSGGTYHWSLSYYDPVRNRLVSERGPTKKQEIAALIEARALWSQIESILDTPDDDLAVAALEALVNGPDRSAMRRFYISFGGIDKALSDPVYVAYSASFYVPFLRHGRRHLT